MLPASTIIITNHFKDTLRLKLLDTLIPKSATTSPDFLLFSDSENIGIDAARQTTTFLSTTPLSQTHKYVVFLHAENLTIPAQNALLKILEEPPSYAQIILILTNPYQLLPTIRSRSVHHLLASTATAAISKSTQDFFTTLISSPHSLLPKVDSLAASKSLPAKLTELVLLARNHCLTTPNPTNLFNLTLLLHTRNLLAKNVNKKLILNSLLVTIKPYSA